MRKEEYIQKVVSRIGDYVAKKDFERELSAHIEDRISYYLDAGWDEDTATEKALEHMGEPEEVAEKMGKLHMDYNTLSKGLLTLTVIGAVKLILAIVFYFSYNTFGGSVLYMLSMTFIMFEVFTDATTMFIGQPVVVLLISLFICYLRHDDNVESKSDYIMTAICMVVWIIAAIVCNQTAMLAF